MLLPLRSLWETAGEVAEAATRGGVALGKKLRAVRPRRIRIAQWSEATVPSRVELAREALKLQIAEEDEILAVIAALL